MGHSLGKIDDPFGRKTRNQLKRTSSPPIARLSILVSNHFDQNGSGPKRTIQTAVARLNSPKNLFERPRETLLLTKTRCKRNFFFLKIREIFSIFFHFDRGDPMKIEKKIRFLFQKKNVLHRVFVNNRVSWGLSNRFFGEKWAATLVRILYFGPEPLWPQWSLTK